MTPQKPKWSVTDEGAARGDLRTLSMATPPLDAERLETLVRYQCALIDETPQTHPSLRKGPEWEKVVAQAHQKALEQTKIDVLELHRLAAMVADVCSRVRTARELQQKRGSLAGQNAPPDRLAEVDLALKRLETLESVKARYGEKNVALLQSRMDELLELQEALRHTS